jgi:NAD(P)H-flavin reductase
MKPVEQITTTTEPIADPMAPELFRIRRIRKETHDTFTFELSPAQSGLGFSFLPGQFNMLYVFGVGEVPISISGDPTDTSLLIHTTRAVGTVTKAMEKMKSGNILGVRGPFGSAWPVIDMEGNDIVIVAGGIGLAPIRPALYHILANRDKYGKVILLYGTRTPEDILFRKEIESLRARFDLEVDVTVDRASGGWRGDVGVVTNLIRRIPRL